jgi:hypothetical protein
MLITIRVMPLKKEKKLIKWQKQIELSPTLDGNIT